MDGGGRFARSVGQPKLQSNPLKKVGGKAQNARTRARSHAATDVGLQNRNSLIARLERWLPNGVGICAAIALLAGAGVLGVIKGGYWGDVTTALGDTRNAMANAAGFSITNVAITGRKHLTQDEILAQGGVTGRSSLLFLDAESVRDRLKANAWISDATVQKLYPGQLRIDIVERAPFALWQHDGNVSVIADNGTVLQPFMASQFTSLPFVVGKGAEVHAKEFLDVLTQFPQLRSAVKAIVYVGERRWNLRMAQGLDVRLPEADVASALAMLTKLDRDENLLSRDITVIDMRLPDRLTVELSEDAAKAREDAFRDHKPKRKAGDA